MASDDFGSISPPEMGIDALHTVFNTVSDAVLVSETNGRVLAANDAAHTRYGYDEFVGRRLAAMAVRSSTDDRPLVDRLHRAAEDGRTVAWAARTADGDVLNEALHPTHTTVDGEPRVIVVARERESPDEGVDHERLLGDLGVGVCRTAADAAGTIRFADTTLAAALGAVSPSQLDGRGFRELAVDADRYAELHDRLLAGPVTDYELAFEGLDGERRWCSVSGDAVSVGGETVFEVGVRETTARTERERALTRIRDRFEFAIEGGNFGVWDWDLTTDAVEYNEQWATILDYDPDDIEPHLAAWESRVHPDDLGAVEADLERHFAGETDYYDTDHRMRTADGEWDWIRTIGKVVERDADGEPLRAVGIHLNVDDRRTTERTLAEQRELFADGPAVVFKWNESEGWPVEDVSDNVTDVFGYTPEELRAGDPSFAEIVHSADVDRVAAELVANSDPETDRFSHEPYRIRTADGDLRWVLDHTKNVRRDGELTHRIGYLIDITAQRQTEAYLETAQEVADVGWWYKEIPSDRIHWSEKVFSMWGVDTDAETIDHETFLRYIHPDDAEEVDAAWAAAKPGEPYDIEHRIVTPDGETKWMRQQAELVFEDGDPVSATGVVQDITEQKRREAELTRLQNRFEQFAENVRDAFFLVSADYTETLYVNDAVERIYGITPEEAYADPESWLRHVHPDDTDGLLAALEDFRNGVVTGTLSQRCRIQHPTRGLRWIEAQIDVVTDDDGTVTRVAGVTTDITERKRRERELEATTRRLTLALEGTDTGVWEWDLETDEVVWTSSMEQLFDVDPGTFEGTYEAFTDYVHPDDRSALEAAIDHTVTTGETLQTEFRIRTTGDRLLWGEVRAELVDDEGGGQRLVGIVTDVTERKEREQELRRNRDLIEQTQENAAIGWWEVDLVADTVHWSDEVYRIHDVPLDDEVPRDDGLGFYHPEDRPTIQEAFDRLTSEGEPYDLELRLVTADDRTRWVRTVADPQVDADGEVVGVLGIFQDITDRKAYETELEQARTELRQIIDLIPDPVFVKNRAGEFLLANEALADCYGETSTTVEGRQESAVMPDASQYESFHEDDLAVIDSGESKQIPEEAVTTADGETRIFSTVKIPYETAHSTDPAVLAYARDITDLKTYERQLETQRDNLDVLNQVVRHDIRNDLQLISAYAEMLDGELDEESQSHLDIIARSADNAIELTTTARDLAETMLQADANRRPMPLARILDGQIDRLLSAESTTVVSVTGELPRVHVFADDLLEAVFRNLLKNAVQHNDTEEPEITIETAVDNDTVTVRIGDNGPGVSDAHKQQIFGRGEQGLESDGTGIGLYLVDTLVDRYGGTVTVEDNEPRGAVFVVELPLAD